MPLDFEEIRLNALEQHIDLRQIAIIYEGLSDEQIESFNINGLLVNDWGMEMRLVGSVRTGALCSPTWRLQSTVWARSY